MIHLPVNTTTRTFGSASVGGRLVSFALRRVVDRCRVFAAYRILLSLSVSIIEYFALALFVSILRDSALQLLETYTSLANNMHVGGVQLCATQQFSR